MGNPVTPAAQAPRPATPTPAAQPQRTTGPAPTGGGAQRTPVNASAAVSAFTFSPVTSQKKQKYLKVLLYGPAGTGKTTLAGSASNIDESSDVLLVTAEGGDMVFMDNPRITRPDLIDQMRTTRIEQLQKMYEWISRHIYWRDQNNAEKLLQLQNLAFFETATPSPEQLAEAEAHGFEPHRVRKYRTIILDSLTDIEAQNMNHILGVSDKGFDIGDDLSPAGYTEFRKNNNTIQQIVRAFRNLDIHVIVICGQKWAKDEKQQFHYTPWLTGQLATQVQSFVDIVGYLVVSQQDPSQPPVRRLYVQPQAAVRFDAKCRIASFNKPFFEEPTIAEMLYECGYVKRSA